MSESKENLKKRIDTNKNQYIENNEVDNFAKDKKNGDIDLNNLGEYLNNLPLYNNDELKKALNNFFRSPERNKYDQTIKNKVTNNQPLDKTELSLMYLAMISEPNKHFTQQQLKFDSSKPVDQICDGALIGFIRTKYNFPTYTGKKVKIDLPNKTKKKTNNPIDKIQESKGGNIKLPENIGEIKESEADFYCDRLITRAEKNFANDIEKAKREIEQNHRYKNEEEKKAYIKRDTLLIAFSKYTEAINSQHEKHITNSGYKDKDDFENQMKLIEEFGKEIERKYPNINNILEKIQKFDEEMKTNEKKYFKNENETKKAEKNYKEFNDYMDKKSKEYDIDKIQESLKKEPKTKEEMEEYLQTMNKIFEFQEDLNKKNKTYGNSISKYQKYIKGAADIQKKYNIQQYQDILENYNQDISNWNKKIDFKKYENYKNGLDWKLEVGIKNINTLQGIITDPDKNKNILVKEFKDIENKQQVKQNGIDRIRERIKKFSPGVYWTLTTFTGLWNGLIDATIGVSTSLGVMILGIIGGTDETLSQMDRKARRDNFFKIGQSSSQKESVYDSETGFNFNADNTVSTVASSISQMLTLIYGGGAIGSGASKVLGISENIAGRVGLFTSSFITQVGGSYQEAITHGLTGKNAIGYSFLSATIQSSLELVSPNDVLLGKGNGITKELIRNACNEGGKQSFLLIGKTFLKNVGLEIIEENIQEGLQTVAGNLINMVVDGTYGSKLGADWSWKNFASTAIITTLTTGITTGVSTGVQMYEMSNQDQTKLIEHIKSDNGLYLEVTGMLDKAIEGKISIPNVSIDQLQNLKLSLTGNSNINTPSRNTNIQTDYEIKSSPEIEQISQILGSRFHEERRQSRLQSDGTYVPRIEKVTDQTWISKHKGQTEVDIANTPFEELPSDWKYENLEAAKVAVGLVYDIVKKGEKVTSEIIEKMAEIVHNKRLERNGIEGSFENQRVPYEQLSESEKEKDRNQLLRAIETITNGKSQGEITIPSGKFEAPNEIANFNDEDGKFEYNNGILTLKENGEQIGNAILKIEENCIYISGLVSFKKGSGTQLIRKIVEISDTLGKGGHIEANASPYFSANGQKSYRNQLTNLGFYYKLGFRAKDPEIHKKIQEYMNKGEEIPLGLNYNRSIYLTDEGIQNLKNKDNSGDNDYFDGKSHKIFEGNTGKAESNSKLSDRILNEINEQNSSAKLEELRNQITEQYKQATGEELELTDEQLLSILDAHEQDGKLGELTLGQLRQKVKTLNETITDPKIRRFLLEAGFCGEEETRTIEPEIYNACKKLFQRILPEKYRYLADKIMEIFIEEFKGEEIVIPNLDENEIIEFKKIIKNNFEIIEQYQEIKESDYDKLINIITSEHLAKNLKALGNLGIKIESLNDFLNFERVIKCYDTECIKSNILTLKENGIEGSEDLSKLTDIITDYDTERIKSNILALKEIGIEGPESLSKLTYIITHYDRERIKSNILALKNLGFSDVEKLSRLTDIINHYDTEGLKSNILILKELGFSNIEDLSNLQNIITSGEAENVKKNILTLKEVGIEGSENLSNLSNIIIHYDTECIKSNILALKELGFSNIEDLSNLTNIIISGETENIKKNILTLKEVGIEGSENLSNLKYIIASGEAENVKKNILTLKEIGIEGPENLQKLTHIIAFGEAKNVKKSILTLKELGFSNIEDLSNLQNIITSGEAENVKKNILTLKEAGIEGSKNLSKLTNIIISGETENIKKNILALKEIGIEGLGNLSNLAHIIIYKKIKLEFKEENHKGYLKYTHEIITYNYDNEKKLKMIEKICSLSFDKIPNYLKIFKTFDESISTDIQRIKNELIDEILKTENPEKNAKKIIDIFEKNNLPLTGKIFKVFEILYPKNIFESTLQEHGSPVLHQYLKEGKDVYGLIYSDLMNIAIKSGDRSLKNYLEIFKGSENLLRKFENIIQEKGFNPEDTQCLKGLSENEKEQILYLFKKISVLYSRYFGKEINEGDLNISDKQLVKFYNEIKKGFNLRNGKSIYDRLQTLLYINGLKYHSVEEVLKEMELSKKQAHERGLNLINESTGGRIKFPEHAFLKGVDGSAFKQIVERGITSREYLGGGENGNAAGSDLTPFDIDGWYTDKFNNGGYGNINLVINTNKENIYNSREDGINGDNKGKYELFQTGVLGEDHYGIRTGIPITEVDYIIYTGDFNLNEFQDICYEIAKNGYYIPITDSEGNIKFTPEMYHQMRQGFNYMHEYEGYDIINNNGKYTSKTQEIAINTHEGDQELQSLIDENSPENPKYKKFAEENNRLAKESLQKIKEILTQECGIKFNSEFDSSITGAEIYDSGSTGRGTDIPTKDVDLDFTLLLDAKDYERVEEIKKIIHEKIGTQKNDDHEVQEGGNQIKSKINNLGKSEERPNGIPLDLLILKKSQVIDFSSSDAMKEKLNIISNNPKTGIEDLNRVKTNIIIMKKLLKAMGCYKKPEGGMSGIGVENRIIQNHGSFIEALESFEQTAYGGEYEGGKQPIPLEDFKKLYPIYDAGENYKDGCNDNFVNKLNENGYNGTLKIIQTYRIEGIEGIRKLIQQYEDKKSSFIGNQTDYFNGKSHQFEVTETQARGNSKMMDNLLNEINEKNKSKKLEELRKNISEQYKEATGEELNLTDEQLLSILDAHEQDGKLGELTLGQLKVKVKILDETITDPKVRRFLLEAGFCGKGIFKRFSQKDNTDYTTNNISLQGNLNQEEYYNIMSRLPIEMQIDKLEPKYKINIGEDKPTLFVTNQLISNGRPFIIGYTFYGDKVHLRMFYKSNSEGNWRACIGMREDNNFSKGETIPYSSYETTTKIDYRMQKIFDSNIRPINRNFETNRDKDGKILENNQKRPYSPIEYITNTFEKYFKTKDDKYYLLKNDINTSTNKVLFPELIWNDNKGNKHGFSGVDFYNKKFGHKIDDVIKGYNNLVPKGLDYEHMKINPNKKYVYYHQYLKHISVQVCTMKLHGKDVEFHFAKALNSPDKVWIENITYADQTLNSWGLPTEEINAGPLIAKPIDYADQCPLTDKNNDNLIPYINETYRDIRNLYQGNPIIKKFKQISK